MMARLAMRAILDQPMRLARACMRSSSMRRRALARWAAGRQFSSADIHSCSHDAPT